MYIVKEKEFEDFDEALEYALQLAEEQANDEGIDPETISTFENGLDPRKYPEKTTQWEAGAGPEGDTCAYWPHVEWIA